MKYTPIMICLLSLSLCVLFSACGHSQPQKESASNVPSAKPAATPLEVFVLRKQAFKKVTQIPGELLPFEAVDVFPKVEGFIQTIYVDRASQVRAGQILARLIAPELEAHITEAKSKVKMAGAEVEQAKAKCLSDQGVYQRLKEASHVPGVISENELMVAQMTAKASESHVQAAKEAKWASISNVKSLEEIHDYLNITAPIDGVVTERNLHPGSLVGPSGAGGQTPIFKIQDINRLRLDVAIPERYFPTIKTGVQIPFGVAAYPDKQFRGMISRPAFALDEKNRTEIVEMDVYNSNHQLSPGMYTEVQWPVERPEPTMVVPASAIVTTTEQTFVIRVKNGKAQWVDIKKGYTNGDEIEIFGDLHSGDEIIKKATDEIRDGSDVQVSNR